MPFATCIAKEIKSLVASIVLSDINRSDSMSFDQSRICSDWKKTFELVRPRYTERFVNLQHIASSLMNPAVDSHRRDVRSLSAR